ncbi:type II/IV secretion system ATPase subunit [Haloglomus litoreum]|uniref:type II/IV secretion system ATPase subunit n=1 Tax=Haloglomus litoreum TaxID=3034026 RepID=UPI0023E88B04|nr:type II/IV secretion system ATPase subunit [Haloglomus sp. DT116]
MGGNDSSSQGNDQRRERQGGPFRSVADMVAGTIVGVRSGLTGLLREGNGSAAGMDVEALGGVPPVPDAVRDHPTRSAVLADVFDYFRGNEEDDQFPAPGEDAIDRRLFDFSYLAHHDEIERYWVNEPFAYVSILEEHGTNERRYRVTEPMLDEYEAFVLDELSKVLRDSLMYQDIDEEGALERTFTRRAGELMDQHTAALDPISLHKLRYYLKRDFVDYERIDPIMRDEAVEDISCDGADVPVFVYHREYRDLDTNVQFDRDGLLSFVTRMAQRAGKHLSVSNPLVDASLPDGSRVQLTFGGDVATRGPNFTIRQFSSVPDTPVDLINWGTFSVEQMAYFWLAIENNRSLVFAGGTGSGKTTSLNAVSFFIPKKSKVVSIEDTREISLPHENWIQSLTRESVTEEGRGEVTMYEQLQTALRQRPEYILVGEIRTEANVALTFFQAMATGHTAYTTIHSESVTGVINRLENDPLGVPTQMVKELDIVSIQRQVMLDGERVRRNARVTELLSRGEVDDVSVHDVFEWDAANDSYNEMFDSRVLDDIADDRGWDHKRLNQELDRRVEVLEYLVDQDITWYEDVARVIHTFMHDQERVLEAIRSDEDGLGSLEADPSPRQGVTTSAASSAVAGETATARPAGAPDPWEEVDPDTDLSDLDAVTRTDGDGTADAAEDQDPTGATDDPAADPDPDAEGDEHTAERGEGP